MHLLTTHIPANKLRIRNADYLYFSGTSYLGLSTHPDFLKILSNSIQTVGGAYGSSRHANVQLEVYAEAEAHLAQFYGVGRALTVSSGTLAGQLALQLFSEQRETTFFMPKTHPAILATHAKPVFKLGKLNTKLSELRDQSIIILADGIPALETGPFNSPF